MYDCGISREGDLLTLAQDDKHKLIDRKGSWLYYGDVGLGQGEEKAREFLRENPALVEEITNKILEKRGLLNPVPAVAEGDGEAEDPEEPTRAPAPRTNSRRQTATTE